RIAVSLADVHPMRAAMVPHAMYSADAALIDRIARFTRARRGLLSVHLAEFAAERAFLRDRTGPLGVALARAGLALDTVARGESPVEAAASVSLLAPDVIAVHLADARRPDLDRLAAARARAVLCPRSNLYIQTLLPPLLDILAAGLRPALGTDSLASNTSLDVLAEAAALRFRFPSVAPRDLFAMATAWGADALDLPLLGRLRPGACPGVLAFELPPGAPAPTDPFAWLLAQRSPSRRWMVRAGDPAPRP
ncbi:MAG: amidohydrolase family protein, partial [Deltaproteobacteria bacterium]